MSDPYASRGPFMPIAGRPKPETGQTLHYLPAIFLLLLILSIVVFKSNSIPARISNEVSQQLKQYPRLASVADVRGRTLVLEGPIEPFPGMEEAISQLTTINGLRRLDDRLIRLNLAPPYLHLKQNEDSIILTGTLNQEDFDSVMAQIQAAFPYLTIRHWIQIEDTVGSPLWLEGLAKGLNSLDSVADLELRGWRNRLQVNGNIPNDGSLTLIRTMAASFIHRIEIENRIVEQLSTDQATRLSLRANQDGLELYVTVKDRELATQIQNAAENVFGLVVGRIELNPNLENDSELLSILPLLPDLAFVKDLRLMSDGDKYVVWGEVSSSNRLDTIDRRIRELGLTSNIKNHIHIYTSNTPAVLTMLRYDKQITLSGKLPSSFVRNQLLQSTQDVFDTKIIEYSLDIEQQIDYSSWIEIWPEVIKSIPLEVFGIAVDSSQVVLTGMPESEEQSRSIALRIGELLPDYQVQNWMRISEL